MKMEPLHQQMKFICRNSGSIFNQYQPAFWVLY